MATVISGILISACPGVGVDGRRRGDRRGILGVRSLASPPARISRWATTAAMFAGAWSVCSSTPPTEKRRKRSQPRALYSSGLSPAGGVFGLLGIIINLLQDPKSPIASPTGSRQSSRLPWRPDPSPFGPKLFGH